MQIQLWRELLTPYDQAVKELTVKLEHLILEHKNKGIYCPIEQVSGRVKAITSIIEKAQKKNVPMEEFEEHFVDIAGIRIICQFTEDIRKVVEILRKRSDLDIIEERDYISQMKVSGYRSYHIIAWYNIVTMEGERRIRVEFQIRTMAMNFWSTVEHSLQYKYKKNIPEHIKKRLLRASDAIIALDNEMSTIRSEIMDAQISSQIHDTIVAEILNNLQNLYGVANEREILKIQDEFYKIYQLDDIDQLTRFHHELDMIAEGYRTQALSLRSKSPI